MGRPQLVVPRHAEQRLNARVLVKQGIAKSINRLVDVEVGQITAEISAAARDPDLAACASSTAIALAASPHASLDQIVTNCIELLS